MEFLNWRTNDPCINDIISTALQSQEISWDVKKARNIQEKREVLNFSYKGR